MDNLQELIRPDEERALDALERGDLTSVRTWLPKLAQNQAGLDALGLHALARKIGKLRRDVGEARTHEILRRIGAQLMKTWLVQIRSGDLRGAIIDLVAVFKHQHTARLAPLEESDEAVTLSLTPCGSGGALDRQGLPEKKPEWYGGWGDGVGGLCQACKANQAALNSALGSDFWSTEKGPNGACRMRFSKLGFERRRLFSDDEREELVRTRVQEAEHRLAKGRSDIADLLHGQRKDWMPWHDFAIVWLEYFYATALEIGGAEYLDEMLAQTYEPAFQAGFPRYAKMTDEELVGEAARAWNYHMAEFTVHEEAERFVFSLDPCGSGGRLYRGQVWRNMFHYGEPLSPLMAEPHRINFQRRSAPTYCTHCASSNRAQLLQAGDGKTPQWFVIDGRAQSAPGLACRQFTYRKALTAVPDRALYEQIGMPRPEQVNIADQDEPK